MSFKYFQLFFAGVLLLGITIIIILVHKHMKSKNQTPSAPSSSSSSIPPPKVLLYKSCLLQWNLEMDEEHKDTVYDYGIRTCLTFLKVDTSIYLENNVKYLNPIFYEFFHIVKNYKPNKKSNVDKLISAIQSNKNNNFFFNIVGSEKNTITENNYMTIIHLISYSIYSYTYEMDHKNDGEKEEIDYNSELLKVKSVRFDKYPARFNHLIESHLVNSLNIIGHAKDILYEYLTCYAHSDKCSIKHTDDLSVFQDEYKYITEFLNKNVDYIDHNHFTSSINKIYNDLKPLTHLNCNALKKISGGKNILSIFDHCSSISLGFEIPVSKQVSPAIEERIMINSQPYDLTLIISPSFKPKEHSETSESSLAKYDFYFKEGNEFYELNNDNPMDTVACGKLSDIVTTFNQGLGSLVYFRA